MPANLPPRYFEAEQRFREAGTPEDIDKLKSDRVWGKAVRDGQMVRRQYVMQDGDVVEIYI